MKIYNRKFNNKIIKFKILLKNSKNRNENEIYQSTVAIHAPGITFYPSLHNSFIIPLF